MLRQDVLNKIAQQLLIDIDNYCNKKWENGFRTHLGASEIGTDCQRKLWYRFRWIVKPEFEPRMKRLLNRGHMEEERILDYLRGIGCVVKPFDDSYRLLIDLTDNSRYFCVHCNDLVFDELDSMGAIDVSNDFLHIKKANEQGVKYPVQYSCSAVEGHFGGSCDGRGYLPKHYGIEEEILFEFKTANEKSFNGLLKDGMQKHQPLHYAQCCAYGYLMKLNYVCYVSACKNDDRLYLEILPFWKANRTLHFDLAATHQHYNRRTRTTSVDINTGNRTLALGDNLQHQTGFHLFFGRFTAVWKPSKTWAIQPGLEHQTTRGKGDRIDGERTITQTSFFLSVEYTPWEWLSIRPGVRSGINSSYKV